MSRRALADLLSVKDLAKRWGCHRNTARRRLHSLNRKHGGTLIVTFSDERGAPEFTTLTLLKYADSRWLEAREIETSRVEELERALATAKLEMSRIRARLREVEDAA